MTRARWLAWVALAACGAPPARPVAPVCPGAATLVASRGDLARLASCATLRGLTVRSGAALDVSELRALTAITGDLVIGPTVAIDDVHLDALRTVGGAVRVAGNGLLRGLYLPRLERAGAIAIDGNAALTTISLPRLVAAGALQVTDDASLEALEVSALTSIDRELVLAGVPRLDLVDAGELRSAVVVRLDAPRLPAEVAERLQAIAAARSTLDDR
jgi:hypothetical protein